MYYFSPPIGGMWIMESDYFEMLSNILYSSEDIIKTSDDNDEKHRLDLWKNEESEIDFFAEAREKIQEHRDRTRGIVRIPKKKEHEDWDEEITGSNMDLFLMLSELLCNNDGIIKIPENADYTLEETIAVIAYAATSTSNSIDAAASELRQKMPYAEIPSHDTVFNYIYGNDIERILAFFRKFNSSLLSLIGLPTVPVDVAVDFHNVGYYGDKNTEGVRGIKPKNGTSWGYSFFTIDLLGDLKLTLDIVDVNALNKDYTILIEGILKRIEEKGITIRKMFLDREFFNLPAILALFNMNVDFIMAAKNNKKIKKILEEHKRKNGVKPLIFNYKFGNKRSPEFYLVAIPNPNYDAKDEKSNEFLLFATSINFGSVEEFVKEVTMEYKKRWNIETGYRVKNVFKIRTCSKKAVARVLFFVVQCILHNYLNVQKRILSITAYELKSLIAEGIQKYFVEKPMNYLSLSEFYAKIKSYNENRVAELHSRLALT
jgi:hypothetical protein